MTGTFSLADVAGWNGPWKDARGLVDPCWSAEKFLKHWIEIKFVEAVGDGYAVTPKGVAASWDYNSLAGDDDPEGGPGSEVALVAPDEIASTTLSFAEARALTDEAIRLGTALRETLRRLYEGGAHIALGYSSWKTYCESEFEKKHWMTGYRVVWAAKVDRALSPWVNGPLPERHTRELYKLLLDKGDEAVVEMYRSLKDEHGDKLTAEKIKTAVTEHLERETLHELAARPAADRPAIDAEGAWSGLPEYEQMPERPKLTITFDDEEQRDRFLAERMPEANVRRKHLANVSVAWPPREQGDPRSVRFVDTENAAPRYPVYIVSKGRSDTRYTAKFLERDGVPYRIVIEPQEFDAYRAVIDPSKILVLPFSNLGQGSIPARNWIWEHAIREGHDRHWILDDNIRGFHRSYRGQRIPCDAAPALRAIEDFTDRYENIAISGPNYKKFGLPEHAEFHVNTHVYSALLIRSDLPQRWRGKYNEDIDLCLQVIGAGENTLLVNAALIDKATSRTVPGGNTDELYAGNGLLEKAESLKREWPGIVSVGMRFGHPHHVVDWKRFKRDLVRKAGVVSDGIDEYGLVLTAVTPPRSPRIRQLLDGAKDAA